MSETATAEAVDEQEQVPDWVTEGDEDVDVGDLSAVADSDVMATARNVTFEVRKATLDTQEYKLEDSSKLWAKRNLHLQLNVASDGIDGEGKYANKAFFVNLLLKVNRDDFPDAFKYDKYAPDGKAWRATKQFYAAMGGDVAAIQITRVFRDEIVGKMVKADIVKRSKRAQVEGEWVDNGFENVIDNYRKAE